MIRKWKTGLLAGSLVLASGTPATASPEPSATSSAAAQCTVTMQRPHYSEEGNGAVVKSNMRCNPRQSDSYDVRLWLCPRPPEGPPAKWPDQACTMKARQAGQIDVRPGGIVRQAPKRVGAQAHGTGWWVGFQS